MLSCPACNYILITIVHTDNLLPCHSLSILCNKPPALRETSRLGGYSVLFQSSAPQEQGQRFLLKHCYQSVKFYLSPLGSILPQFHNSPYNFCSHGKGGAGFQEPRRSKSLIWKSLHHLDILHPQELHERGKRSLQQRNLTDAVSAGWPGLQQQGLAHC